MMVRHRLVGILTAAMAAFSLNPSSGAGQETVFVAGATGRTGSAIVTQLIAEGYAVVGLTRDGARTRADGERERWVQGDVRDYASLLRGMAGADYVVSAIGSTTGTGPNAAEFVDFAGTRNLVDAAKAVGAKQFVLIASGRTGPHIDHSTHKNFGYARHFKTKGEQYLKASGLPYTILGAAGLVEKPGGQMGVRLFSRVEYDATTKSTDEMAVIAIPDIAAVVAAALKDSAARGKAFAVMNDPKLPVGGWRQGFTAVEPSWP